MEPEDPPRKYYTTKPREFDRVNAVPGTQAKSDEHDIHALLRHNRAVEKSAKINEVEIKRVTSRRKRDYWLLLVPGNLLVAVLTWPGRGNPFVLVCGLSGMVALSLGLTWIMWFVMSDY